MKIRFFRILCVIVYAFALLLAGLAVAACTMLATDDTPTIAAPKATADTLRAHVEELCRVPRFGDTLYMSREYIETHFQKAGWQVTRQHFTTSDGEEHYNICAQRPGKSSKRYIIGAHYDACDPGTGEQNPGADDNASAVAALIELAYRLPKEQQEHGVELVAWACEEPPWFNTEDMGSAHHATTCNKDEVLGLICLEMLGYYLHEPDSQPSYFTGQSLLLPSTGNFIAVVGDTAARPLAKALYRHLRQDMPAVRLNIPWAHDTALYFSDHRNYHPYGIPAVMVTDTAMLRNPHYHEPTDTPDTLDYNSMAVVTRALTRAVVELLRG